MADAYQEDIPADRPAFDYDLVARALAPLLIRRSRGATVVGIHGQWGSGKTTLMQALKRELHGEFAPRDAVFIEFNAWKYQQREALWRALILRVLGALKDHGADPAALEELEASLYRSFAVEEKGPWRVNWQTVIAETLGLALSLVKLDFVARALTESTGFFGRLLTWNSEGKKKGGDGDKQPDLLPQARIDKLASVLERTTVQRQVVQLQSIEQFLQKFDALINESRDGDRRRVFVFIDDLDRCLPESALEIFEAIKLFLDASGCGYVIALDRDVIRKGLAVRYRQQSEGGRGLFIDPDEYIEKTISVSYDLPRLSTDDARSLIGGMELPVTLEARHHQIILAGLGTNPRRIKRFMNGLSTQLALAGLAKGAGRTVHPSLLSFENPAAARQFDYFLKLAVIGYKYSGVLGLALRDEGLLGRLQVLSNQYAADFKLDPATARTARNLKLDAEPGLLLSLKTEEEFWRLMSSQPSVLDDPVLTNKFLGWFREPKV